jgi:3-oxoacyl-[acyl-carrier-protein] synthase-3
MIRIAGTGLYAPGEAIPNDELKKLAGIEFDAERIEEKLGIRERHIAHLRNIDETTADFAEAAARRAIEDAGLDPQEIDLFVVGTDTPEYISPATSMIIQGRIQGGQRFTGTWDLGASCSGFVAALDAVARLVATDPGINNAVVVGVYNMPAYFRPGDVFGYSIFADGAAAAVLQKSESGTGTDGDSRSSRYLGGQLLADGTQWDYVGVYTGGTRKPATVERLESGEYGLQLLQRLPGDRNVKLWPEVVGKLLEKTKLAITDIDHIIFTQINRSVILEVMGILGLPEEKTTCIMDRFGYTGSACVPMAFHTAVTEGRINRGDTVVLVASGAGLSVASAAFVY